ncbi:MAG: hypothetical protein WDO24_27160 [Pseudomonadota bacterium]
MHLIGSVPLADSEQVFRRVAGELGPYLARIPDGETAERARWIYFQRHMLEAHPAMELDMEAAPLRLHQWDGRLLREAPFIRFKPDTDLESVSFDTGYDRAAVESYGVFKRLRDAGAIRRMSGSRSACRRRSPAPTCMSARSRATPICGSTSAT